MPRQSILVAIAGIDRTALPLLKKAATLARQLDADLELLHVVALPYGPVGRAPGSVRAAFNRSGDEKQRDLQALGRSPVLRGIDVSTTVEWDYPASDAIVRQVMRRRPRLLIVESQRHARLSRIVMSNTDWDLIRHCPCPLLLSKSSRIAPRPRVVAAIDPLHSRAKPAGLDARIFDAALALAGSAKRVFAFHAHIAPRPLLGDAADAPYWFALSESDYAAYEDSVRKRVYAEAARFDIPEANIESARGDVASQLPRFVDRKRADIVVMGAVSRSGLKRIFIGNTAERLIDRLECDVLVVKPRGFKAPVPRQRPPFTAPYPPFPLAL